MIMLAIIVSGLVGVIIIYVIYTLQTGAGSGSESTNINAFIIESDDQLTHSDKKEAKRNPYYRKYDKAGKQLLILYGTEYGFSEEIAKKLFDRIDEYVVKEDQLPWQPRLVNARYHEHLDWSREKLAFIVISTAGDGIPPSEARPFCTWLDTCSEKYGNISFSVLALGDTNYPHFCRTGKVVNNRFQELGSNVVVPRHDVDMEDWGVINKWIDQVISVLDNFHMEPDMDYLDLPDSEEDDTGPTRSRPFMATLTVKRYLTSQELQDDKETIHCEFDLKESGISWTSGDALGIYPENNTPEVDRLLKVLNCMGDEVIEVPKWAYEPAPEKLTLRNALQKYYDLKTVRPELIQLLCKKSDDKSGKSELEIILKEGISKKNTLLQEYLYEREVADVLSDYQQVANQLSTSNILDQMKGLQPRYYSIASSPVQCLDSCSVAAAVVRYTTLGLPRTGVTTTYLQDRLLVSQQCPVFISQNPEFRLPEKTDVPIIMVGPGTGIAPFMAFVSERVALQSTGKNIFYFGCRHKNKDFLYKEELENWARNGHLHLRTAFSRDQPHKVYVQDLIREDGKLLYNLINDEAAHIYICGDARHMAHDVHKELLSIICEYEHITMEQAMEKLQEFERNGRYQKDVWVT